MGDSDNALREGEMRITITLRLPVVAGQAPVIQTQLEGVNSPFDGIRLVRVAEDEMRGHAEAAVNKIMAANAPAPHPRILRLN